MIEHIIEYAVLDLFPMLALSSEVARRTRKGIIVEQENFKPALVKLFADPSDIPSEVTVEGMKRGINMGLRAARPAVTDHVKLVWLDQNKRMHRDVGPARIVLEGISKWHIGGVLHRDPADGVEQPAVKIDLIKFQWIKRDKQTRADGPAQILVHGFQAIVQNGTPRGFGCRDVTYEWDKLAGKMIPQKQVESFLEDYPDEPVNMWGIGPFFEDPMGEILFMERMEA